MDTPRFGSFNLHKRHGLGDWQGKSEGSNQSDWLQQVQKADDAANPIVPHPTSSRFK